MPLYLIIYNNSVNIELYFIQFLYGSRGENEYNYALWFLPCLFCIYVYNFIIFKFLKLIKLNEVISVIVVLLISYIMYPCVERSKAGWFSADIALVYSSFFVLGYWFKNNLDNVLDSITFCIVGRTSLVITLVALSVPNYYNTLIDIISSYQNRGISYFWFVFSGLVGISACITLARIVYECKILEYVGKKSFFLMGKHLFLITGIYYFFITLGLAVNQYNNLYCIIVSVITLKVLCRFSYIWDKYHIYITRGN